MEVGLVEGEGAVRKERDFGVSGWNIGTHKVEDLTPFITGSLRKDAEMVRMHDVSASKSGRLVYVARDEGSDPLFTNRGVSPKVMWRMSGKGGVSYGRTKFDLCSAIKVCNDVPLLLKQHRFLPVSPSLVASLIASLLPDTKVVLWKDLLQEAESDTDTKAKEVPSAGDKSGDRVLDLYMKVADSFCGKWGDRLVYMQRDCETEELFDTLQMSIAEGEDLSRMGMPFDFLTVREGQICLCKVQETFHDETAEDCLMKHRVASAFVSCMQRRENVTNATLCNMRASFASRYSSTTSRFSFLEEDEIRRMTDRLLERTSP